MINTEVGLDRRILAPAETIVSVLLLGSLFGLEKFHGSCKKLGRNRIFKDDLPA